MLFLCRPSKCLSSQLWSQELGRQAGCSVWFHRLKPRLPGELVESLRGPCSRLIQDAGPLQLEGWTLPCPCWLSAAGHSLLPERWHCHSRPGDRFSLPHPQFPLTLILPSAGESSLTHRDHGIWLGSPSDPGSCPCFKVVNPISTKIPLALYYSDFTDSSTGQSHLPGILIWPTVLLAITSLSCS